MSLGRDEALELMRSAGLGSDLRLQALVHPLLQDRYGSLLKTIFTIWSELGVQVDVKNTGMADYLDAFLKGELFDLMIGRWNADYDDPDNFSYSLFHSQAGRWRKWFSSPAADQMLEEARTETRPAAREGLYRRFEACSRSPRRSRPSSLTMTTASPARRCGDSGCGARLGSVRGLPHPGQGGVGRADGGAWSRRRRIAGVVTSLDPALADTVEQHETIPCVLETLTRDVKDARIVPWLAAEVRVEDEGRRYRDVRYSLERMLQRGGESRWLFSPMRGAKALLNGEGGDLTGFRIHSAADFSIELEEPVSFFPVLLSNPTTSVVPEGSDPGGSGIGAWVGTGPFRVVAFEPGRRLELERNRAYWRAEYPRSEGLVFSLGVSPEEMLAGFRAGRFSLASDLYTAAPTAGSGSGWQAPSTCHASSARRWVGWPSPPTASSPQVCSATIPRPREPPPHQGRLMRLRLPRARST